MRATTLPPTTWSAWILLFTPAFAASAATFLMVAASMVFAFFTFTVAVVLPDFTASAMFLLTAEVLSWVSAVVLFVVEVWVLLVVVVVVVVLGV